MRLKYLPFQVGTLSLGLCLVLTSAAVAQQETNTKAADDASRKRAAKLSDPTAPKRLEKQPAPPKNRPVTVQEAMGKGPQPSAAATVTLKPGEVPTMVFDTPIYDFGKIKAGPKVQHEYWFTNTGTGPLEILSVRPSCGCTTAGHYEKVIQPGQSGKIPVEISSEKLTGTVAKSITVATNIPGKENLFTLQLKGEVFQMIDVSPQMLSIGRITAEQIETGTPTKLTITNNGTEPLKIENIAVNDPGFKLKLTTLEEGKKYEIEASPTMQLRQGDNRVTLEIPTHVNEHPKIEIPIYAFLAKPIEVSPEELVIPATLSAELNRQLYIRVNTTREIKISDAKATNPDMKVSVEEVNKGKFYRLSCQVPVGYTAKEGDQITLATDDSSQPSITIPVTRSVQATVSPQPIAHRRPTNPNAESASLPRVQAKPKPTASAARLPINRRVAGNNTQHQADDNKEKTAANP